MLTINLNRCKACGLCADVCPKKAITINPSLPSRCGSGAAELTGECVECGLCYEICPDIAIMSERGAAEI